MYCIKSSNNCKLILKRVVISKKKVILSMKIENNIKNMKGRYKKFLNQNFLLREKNYLFKIACSRLVRNL